MDVDIWNILFFHTGDILKMAWEGRVSSDLYCYHHNVLWKYILESQTVLFCHVYNNISGLKIVEAVIWKIL